MAVRRELSSSLQFPLRNSAVVDHERENINFEGQFHFDMDTDYKQTFGIGNGKCWNSMTGLTNQSDGLLNSNSNVTENVTVPSSFHVAEIVGKQGIKIKRIRATTNTWIKTPARGDDPTFIITGRKEGVEQAKAEILTSAEKVARLIALRTYHHGSSPATDQASGTNSPVGFCTYEQDSIQIKVSVPANTVGLIIGPKGARIKDIAESTSTYIKTPNKFREPIFEIVGLPGDVERARNHILTFINDKMNDDYIKQMMSQMPVHEPGSPVKLDPPLATANLRGFTKLRPPPSRAASPLLGSHLPSLPPISSNTSDHIEQLSRVLEQAGHIPINSFLSVPADLFSNPADLMSYARNSFK